MFWLSSPHLLAKIDFLIRKACDRLLRSNKVEWICWTSSKCQGVTIAKGNVSEAYQSSRPSGHQPVFPIMAKTQLSLFVFAPKPPFTQSIHSSWEVATQCQGCNTFKAQGSRCHGIGLRAKAQTTQGASTPHEALPLWPANGSTMHGPWSNLVHWKWQVHLSRVAIGKKKWNSMTWHD